MKKIFGILILFLTIGCSGTEFANGVGGISESEDKKDKNVDKDVDEDGSIETGNDFVIENAKGIGADGELIVGEGESTSCTGIESLNLPGVTKYNPNMVPDGDFESVAGGITSDYAFNDLTNCLNTPGNYKPDIGSYAIVDNPFDCHAGWDNFGGSKIAIFNGAASGRKFWCKTFEVTEETTYAFSIDTRLLHHDGGVNSDYGSGMIRWTIDDVELIPERALARKWETRGILFESEQKTSLTLCGENTSANNSGNDWAIDNICLVAQ